MKTGWRSILSGSLWAVFPAATIWLAFAVVSALGWRADTTFLSGTMGDGGWNQTVERGCAYTTLYVGATLVSPALVVAAALSAFWDTLSAMTEPSTPV